jgi:hypothetical protein
VGEVIVLSNEYSLANKCQTCMNQFISIELPIDPYFENDHSIELNLMHDCIEVLRVNCFLLVRFQNIHLGNANHIEFVNFIVFIAGYI